jgi:hypothetical protein
MSETKVSQEYITSKAQWAGCGHWGATCLHVEGETSGPVGGPSVEGLLGRELGPGSKIRVTVEVLEEVELNHADHVVWQHKNRPEAYCAECRRAMAAEGKLMSLGYRTKDGKSSMARDVDPIPDLEGVYYGFDGYTDEPVALTYTGHSGWQEHKVVQKIPIS